MIHDTGELNLNENIHLFSKRAPKELSPNGDELLTAVLRRGSFQAILHNPTPEGPPEPRVLFSISEQVVQ